MLRGGWRGTRSGVESRPRTAKKSQGPIGTSETHCIDCNTKGFQSALANRVVCPKSSGRIEKSHDIASQLRSSREIGVLRPPPFTPDVQLRTYCHTPTKASINHHLKRRGVSSQSHVNTKSQPKASFLEARVILPFYSPYRVTHSSLCVSKHSSAHTLVPHFMHLTRPQYPQTSQNVLFGLSSLYVPLASRYVRGGCSSSFLISASDGGSGTRACSNGSLSAG